MRGTVACLGTALERAGDCSCGGAGSGLSQHVPHPTLTVPFGGGNGPVRRWLLSPEHCPDCVGALLSWPARSVGPEVGLEPPYLCLVATANDDCTPRRNCHSLHNLVSGVKHLAPGTH